MTDEFEAKKLQDAAKLASTQALQSQQQYKQMCAKMERLCDDLLKAGNTVEALREYWPDYRPPAERV